MTNRISSKFVVNAAGAVVRLADRPSGTAAPSYSGTYVESQLMLGRLPPDVQPALGERSRPFPLLDRAFDAVERALAKLGVEDPASLRSPRPVEEALSATALPFGTLLVLSPSELRAAEVDIEETVKDERSGGTVFVTLPRDDELATRKRSLRELAVSTPTYCLTPNGSLPTGMSRLSAVHVGDTLADYDLLFADTAGFRVAIVRRALPGGGWIALWTGNEQAIAELDRVLRRMTADDGAEVPRAANDVPVLAGVDSVRDVWSQAAELRAYRVVREAELREIARQAALKGVAMRREREAKKRAAG